MQPDNGHGKLKILGKSSSINVRKVLWTCEELALEYEHEQWGSGFQSTETASFRALNPNALVPVIVERDFVLWESNAICRYLSDCAKSELLPRDPRPRAQVEQWMDWQATELNNSWRYAFMSLVRRSHAHAEPSAVAAGIQEWNRHMTIIEAQLARTGAYMTGEAFTLADIVIGLSVNRWFMTPIDRPVLPAIESYYERLNGRPGYRLHGRNGTP